MPITLDHVVLVVPSLAEGIERFEADGFTVSPGGRHQELSTENALVAFADGTYLELLTTRDPEARPHLRQLAAGDEWSARLQEATALGRRFLPLLALPDGVCDLALHGAPLARLAREARRRGHVLTGPTPMQRTRRDGVSLAWQMLIPEAPSLPFMIEDDTPRPLRVPSDESAVAHANGATGIAGAVMAVASVPLAAMAWADLFGVTPRVDGAGDTVLALGSFTAVLREGERCGATEVMIGGIERTSDALAHWGVHSAGG